MNHDDLFDAELASRMREALALRDAPAAWIRAAEGLWPEHGPGIVGAARRLIASLRFDSATASPALSGVRGGASTARHLLFSADGRDVDLRITASGEAYSLAGQILGPDESGHVEIVRTETAAASAHRTELNALGEFRLDDLAAGRYRVTLSLGGDEILLPEIDVGDGGR